MDRSLFSSGTTRSTIATLPLPSPSCGALRSHARLLAAIWKRGSGNVHKRVRTDVQPKVVASVAVDAAAATDAASAGAAAAATGEAAGEAAAATDVAAAADDGDDRTEATFFFHNRNRNQNEGKRERARVRKE